MQARGQAVLLPPGEHTTLKLVAAATLFGLSFPITAGEQIRSITRPEDPRLNLYAITLA